MHFIKIYHYSSTANLEQIDPNQYGSGVSRGREFGLKKSYFYLKNEPEPCVRTNNFYEIYLPKEDKSYIYDLSEDKENFYDQAKAIIISRENRAPYQYEIQNGLENLIAEAGYKGYFCPTSPQLPHAMILFEAISTQKPKGFYKVEDWAGNTILETKLSLNNKICMFGNSANPQHSNEAPPQSLRA